LLKPQHGIHAAPSVEWWPVISLMVVAPTRQLRHGRHQRFDRVVGIAKVRCFDNMLGFAWYAGFPKACRPFLPF
jgi:hypothetical protein